MKKISLTVLTLALVSLIASPVFAQTTENASAQNKV